VSAAEEPGGRGRYGPGVRRRRALVAVAGAAWAGVAATTTPFSRPANLVTSLPIIGLALLLLVRWPFHVRPAEPEAGTVHPWRAWAVLSGLVVAWELAEYASRGSRGAHPTLSSLLNAGDRHEALKAVVFFLWLCLGAAIAEAGRREHRRRREPRPGPS
jgi:hypothetical protein